MMTSSFGNIFRVTGFLSPVTGEFPAQGPVTQSFDVFFDLGLDQQFSKQWRRRRFETPWRSLWRHCNVLWSNACGQLGYKACSSMNAFAYAITMGLTVNIFFHYCDAIMGAMASEITSLTIVYSAVYSGADQRKHQNSASLAFLLVIHQWPVNSLHKWPVTWKMLPFDDVIMHSNCAAHSLTS